MDSISCNEFEQFISLISSSLEWMWVNTYSWSRPEIVKTSRYRICSDHVINTFSFKHADMPTPREDSFNLHFSFIDDSITFVKPPATYYDL